MKIWNGIALVLTRYLEEPYQNLAGCMGETSARQWRRIRRACICSWSGEYSASTGRAPLLCAAGQHASAAGFCNQSIGIHNESAVNRYRTYRCINYYCWIFHNQSIFLNPNKSINQYCWILCRYRTVLINVPSIWVMRLMQGRFLSGR